MMKIKRIDTTESSYYLDKLIFLIDTVIDLPEEAKISYKNQWTNERIIDQIDNWLFISAEEDNKMDGIILGTPIEGGVATIIWILVDKSAQKKGIGQRLFSHAVKYYEEKGAHKIKLTVPDRKTVDFYIKQGMNLEGEHRNHWWNHDFWAMGMNIKKEKS